MRRLRALLVGLVIACPFYLLLIDTVSSPELLAGAAAVLIAAGAYEFTFAEGAGHASYRVRWLLGAWRVFADAPAQVLTVCREIVSQTVRPRDVRGELRGVHFSAGENASPDIGRRVLAEALGSITPNTIVVGVDADAEMLLVHQLRPGGSVEQLDPLGLR